MPEADPARRRVLFVDDERNILAGLRRSLYGQRQAWEMFFAAGGEEALALMAKSPVDVVVSDMRMPGMDGGQLLAEVRRRHPETARIILSGHADQAAIVSAIGPTQQYLAKPCEADILVAVVDRVIATRDIVQDPGLRAVLGGVETLPKPPAIYEEMVRLAGDPECRIEDVVAVVERDVATTAEVLRLVNSAFFGLPTRVPTVARAISLLGLDVIQALALAGAVFAPGQGVPPGLDLAALSGRGLATGTLARCFAKLEGWGPQAAADLFLAGLMHEVGLVVLAGADPEGWRRVRAAGPESVEQRDDTQREVFGCSVTQASAYLLGLWGFSEMVVHSIAGQPAPPGERNAGADAQLLSVARHLAEPAGSPVEPVEGSFVDAGRLAAWQAAAAALGGAAPAAVPALS